MRADRLLKLAEFLDTLPPQKFHFGDFVTKHDGKCGTVCCAVGWCPKVFPGEWAWTGNGYSVQLTGGNAANFRAAAEFFGVPDDVTFQLFDPLDSGLGYDATPTQVAAHIRKFVHEARQCRTCGEVMEWEKADPGDPRTHDCPMGGAPGHPAGWWCENGHFEEDDCGTSPLFGGEE